MNDIDVNIGKLKRLRKKSLLIVSSCVLITLIAIAVVYLYLKGLTTEGNSLIVYRNAYSILLWTIFTFLIIWIFLGWFFFSQNRDIVKTVLLINKGMEDEIQERTEELNFTGHQLVELTNTLDTLVIDRTEELRESNKKLKISNEELQRFAQVASHDMKEPLRMIASYLQLLKRKYNDLLDEEGREFVHFAVDGSTRLQKMIDDLLQYARLEKSAIKEFAPVNLNTVFDEVLQNLQVAIAESSSNIKVVGELPTIEGDNGLLSRLFQNLISNAIKFRGDDPPLIEVKCEEKGNNFHSISISDNGIGMAQKDIEKIFQIFKRLQTNKKYEGNGIGLAVSKKVVEMHGGRIEVKSKIGIGTTFSIYLPKCMSGEQAKSDHKLHVGLQ